MPRYFFHLHNDINAPDEEGSLWADDKAAVEHAIVAARDVASASVLAGHLNLKDHIDIVGEDGRSVRTVTFRDAVKIKE